MDRRTLLKCAIGAGLVGVSSTAKAQSKWAISTGKVVMARDRSDVWRVFSPFGDPIDLRNSATSGLQEATDFAATNGYDLEVAGGPFDAKGKHRAVIRCQTMVAFPPLENAHWTIGGVFIDFSKPIEGDGFLFDSILHSSINFRGTMFYRGDGPAVHLFPRANYPGGQVPLAVDNDFAFFRVLPVGGNKPSGFRMSPTRGTIVRNRIHFTEIEGGSGSTMTGSLMPYGVDIAVGAPVISNWVIVQALLRPKTAGIRIGDRAPSEAHMTDNRFEAHIVPVGASAVGVSTWGRRELHRLSIVSGQPSMGAGIVLEASAANPTMCS